MKKTLPRLTLLKGILFGLPLLCILALAASVFSNIGLPSQSADPERLSPAQSALLSEAYRLQSELGDLVWPGWGAARVPIIVHNEAYAFLVGYDGQPPQGWRRVPGEETRGGDWEPVDGDEVMGEVYYRQPLLAGGPTPENFVVLIGDEWAATLYTREFARIALYLDFERQAPFPVNKILPYRLLWRLLLGTSETYLGALLHEVFHAYQANIVPGRLDAAESSIAADTQYPWDDPELTASWQAEMELLADGVRAESLQETRSLACQFVQHRDARRATFALEPSLIALEREREWLEGQAKYVELTLLRLAGESSSYVPFPDLADDSDFLGYRGAEDYYWQQVGEVARLSGRSGDTRFYYTGFAQAAMLDRLTPGWQARAFDPGIYLENLLEEVCSD